VHEFFAQSLTVLCILEEHATLLDGLRKLSHHQSSVYRAWGVFDAFTQNKVVPYWIRGALQALFLGVMNYGDRLTPDE
jgi:hypothetical protein